MKTVHQLNDQEMFAEVKARYIEGQSTEEMAQELQLPVRLIAGYYNKVRASMTMDEYSLPPAVLAEVALAHMNKIMIENADSSDPRAAAVSLRAAIAVTAHPIVRNLQPAVTPNWSKIGQIGGDVPLEGLLAEPEEKKP